MPPAEAKIVRADIQTSGHSIGYVPGAGDDIPQSLEQIGYTVKMLEPAEVKAENLARFDAVVLGIRAYNTQDRIADWQSELLAYVKAGGVVVAQYNTTADLKTKDIGPFRSRFRATASPTKTLKCAFSRRIIRCMNTPNKITAADFKGWVQERGLYFPNKWDPRWTPILSCHDPGVNRRSTAGCLLPNPAKAISSTLAIPGFANYPQEFPALIGFSRTWFRCTMQNERAG